MRSLFSMVISVMLTTGVVACVMLPQKLTLGTSTDERFKGSGYSASLSWDLRPKRVVQQDYTSTEGGTFAGDAP